jgi:DNA polymerase
MNFDSLKDLELAGVQWELKDAPNNAAADNIRPNTAQTNTDAATAATHTAHATGQTIYAPTMPPVAADAAQIAVANANDTNSLFAAIAEFNHPLKMFAKNVVPPHLGNNDLIILVITDTPSSDDDNSGQILSGTDGELFDKMISAIGLGRADIAICPLVFWRTPGGRTPTDEELNLTRPFVNKFVELSQSKIILTLGALAARRLAADDCRLFSIPHPRDIQANSDLRKPAWDTLQNLLKVLKK